jgi:SAM-dependent methyltransferase
VEPSRSYLFAANELSAEEVRLDLLEELLDRETEQLLERVGLPRGGRYLDVGAGHGSVVSFRLARCGARGQVVATDVDTRFLDRVAHPRLVVLRHDMLADDLDQLGRFDLVHARFLLHHLGDQAGEALARMVSLLAPGGRIAVEEPLWDNRYDPSHPDAERLQAEDDALEAALRQRGIDFRVAMTFPRRLVDLGLVERGQ